MIWRKLLSVLFFIASLQTVHAQIPKGTIMTGGNISFQFSTDHESNGNMINFSFDPYIGGFVVKNFVLGISPIITYAQQTGNIFNNSFSHRQFAIGAGPFARYYFKIAPSAYVFIHAAPVSLAAEWDRTENPVYSRYATINWTVGPGISVMVAKGIAVEIGAYYHGMWHQFNDYQNGVLVGNAGHEYVDHGMVLNVGFQVYIERKKKEKQAAK